MATPSASSSFRSNFVYIYDIPWTEQKRLTCQLDQDGKWVPLALKRMGYGAVEVEDIQRCCAQSGRSPAEQLLKKWGNLNHTITDLFVVMSQEGLFSAMEIIKRFVDPQLHYLIKQESLVAESRKELNGPPAPSAPVLEHSKDGNSDSVVPPAAFQQKEPAVAPPVVPVVAPQPPQVLFGPASIPGGLPQFSYEELRSATDNWSKENELGRGGFGIVYKGFFKLTHVAIKKIKGINTESARTELRQSFNELKYLNSCRHENVVPLLGCCLEQNEPCLVYQLMPGGSLDNRLFPKTTNARPLSMLDRIKIAKGTAKGLQYLHTFTAKPIIHGDIKPGNILLDNNNEPKIGDFGLTRELSVSDSSMKVSRVYGTRPYIPHEFFTYRQLSTKVDSFSYGLVLYEMITGQRVYDDKRPIKHLKDVVDNAIASKYDIRVLMDRALLVVNADDVATVQACRLLLTCGVHCTVNDPDRRLEMVQVYKFLMTQFGA
uniref:non-specific serine/threonine protein kinase n=2 Tax=Culex pipiens TaxID=7175 RepID=A0A8D8DSJ1_CULPI